MQVVTPDKDVLDVLIELLVVVLPVVVAWFIRTYVRGSTAEKQVAAIVRLSNSAIDFVENLDRRGDLSLPPDIKKGSHKLKLAAGWLEDELKRAGVSISDEDAQKWIASEFQKRMGDVRPVKDIAEATRAAVNLILSMDRTNLIDLPPGADRIAYLAGLAADWVLSQLSMKSWSNISREEVLTVARAEFVRSLSGGAAEAPADDQLTRLAQQAVEFLEQLKASGRLTIQPGAPGETVERDVATAWLLTEAARQGLTVTSGQIAEAITSVLGQSSGARG